MSRPSTAVLLVLCATAGACQRAQQAAGDRAAAAAPGRVVAIAGGRYHRVSVPELHAMLAVKDFLLINVHVPFAGDLPGTDASIPYDHIAEHLDQLPADRNAQIVLYCRSGSMSTEAAIALVKLGYTNVYHLDGGFSALQRAGLPMAGS